LLDCGMLGASVCELWERSKKGLNSRPLHLTKLSGEDSFTPPGAD
jgi:hypothetical protein